MAKKFVAFSFIVLFSSLPASAYRYLQYEKIQKSSNKPQKGYMQVKCYQDIPERGATWWCLHPSDKNLEYSYRSHCSNKDSHFASRLLIYIADAEFRNQNNWMHVTGSNIYSFTNSTVLKDITPAMAKPCP